MEMISMSRKERLRLEVLSRVRDGVLPLAKAAELLEVSYRQVKRLRARYQAAGDAGLVHGLRGLASNRQPRAGLKEQALELYQTKYADYGPTLACECLQADDEVVVVPETLRRWLKEAGVWNPRRRRKVHRRRRDRREQRGELVQMDGSHHDWFEGRRGEAVLMVIIDDATSVIHARFFEEETLVGALETFGGYARGNGLPGAVYVDRSGIYRTDREPTPEELLAGIAPQTQFGRAMTELGVKLILARSPQAKGRVERVNRTLQDRLVKALRRAGVCDLQQANAFLADHFLASFNARFSVEPTKSGDVHRKVASELDLDRILAVCEERTVQHDWSVRWHNRFLQLPRSASSMVQPGQHVTVCEQLDGRLRLFYGEQELSWSDTRSEPVRSKKRRTNQPPRSSQGQKPSADHPWRQFCLNTPSAAAREMASSAPAR